MLRVLAAAALLVLAVDADSEEAAATAPPLDAAPVAVPNVHQLAYQELELGVLIQYNIGMYGTKTDNYACAARAMPPSAFSPSGAIDTDQWLASAKQLGATYALLTTQAGCGFLLWPTEVKHTGGPLAGKLYNQTVRESGYAGGDLVKSFVQSCAKFGIKPAFYYIAATNKYCSVDGGAVAAGGGLCGGQSDYEALVLAQLRELWTHYGELAELWFDGDTPDKKHFLGLLSKEIVELQPTASVFGGWFGSVKNPVRWIGTESGIAPEDNWSADLKTAGDGFGNGAGVANGSTWVPADCDVTLQASGGWYWKPDGATPRSLAQLQTIYEASIGRNCNMELGFHPNYDGVLPEEHVAAVRQFGEWVSSCYGGAPLAASSAASVAQNSSLVLPLRMPVGQQGDSKPNRVVLAENQTAGQRVRQWSLWYSSTAQPGPDTTWHLLTRGGSIGHKRIVPVPENVSASALRLDVDLVVGSAAHIRVFEARSCNMTAPPTHSSTCSMGLTDRVRTGHQLSQQANSSSSACCVACEARPSACVAFNLFSNLTCQLLDTEGGERTVSGAISGAPNSTKHSAGGGTTTAHDNSDNTRPAQSLKIDDEQAVPIGITRDGAWAPFWGETSPVVWNTSRLLRMATRYPQPCAPGDFASQGGYVHLSVHDVASGKVIVDPIPMSEGTSYGSGYTAPGLGFHAFGSTWCMHNCGGTNPASGPHACRYGSGGTQVIGFRSIDPALQEWTGGTVALQMSESGKRHGCSWYNTDVHRGSDIHGYVMAIETVCTNATDEWGGFSRGGFHNVFAVHAASGNDTDLTTGWKLLDPLQFLLPMRSEHYWLVNCPTIRFIKPYYYIAPASFDYDKATGKQTTSRLSTWLARSTDLHSWEKSAAPLVAPSVAAGDKKLNYKPGSSAEAKGLQAVNDTNASDLDWVELPNGTVHLEWSMGCQTPTIRNCNAAMYAVSATTVGTGGEAAWLASHFDT